MSTLEQIDGRNWEEFLQAPVAVLMLGKSDCPACGAWTDELSAFLASDGEFAHVRFGKILLDKGGLIGFKRAHPWIAELDVLPFNQIFIAGERSKSFAGGGLERLLGRLRQLA
ncbi:MAG TPA: hypothetical protein VGK30_06460 [Candidatus Binatia bacterium]|jgi:hypothetical protein